MNSTRKSARSAGPAGRGPGDLQGFAWDDLRVFLAVIEQGSLSRAAESLGMSQPTVGRRLDALEEALDGPLIERTSQGCVPTEAGAMLAPLVERMRAAADGIKRAAATARRDIAGTVRVAVGELIGRLLARHADQIIAGAPGLRLEIVVGMARVSLGRGEAEIAIRAKKPESRQLYARKLPRSPFAVYGAPSYVDSHPVASDERRYRACRWASFDDSLAHLRSARWLADRLAAPEPSLRFSTSSLILEAAASGAALAVLPVYVGDDDPRLIRLEGPLEDLYYDGWLVTHTSSRRLPRVRWVADRIAELLGKTI